MALVERKAASLTDILSEAKAIRDGWNPSRDASEEIWFRGQPKRRYQLVPGLYREATLDLGYDELALFYAFTHLGFSYAEQRPVNDWEWYFVAQHHGLPTRLLDWTESLLAATYFAIEDHWRSTDKRDLLSDSPYGRSIFDEDSPVVWIVDAGTINLVSQGEDVLFAPPSEKVKSYLPRYLNATASPGCFEPIMPIALHPPRQTGRIIAQQAMFTIHGRDTTPLDVLADVSRGEDRIKLGCICLDRARIGRLVDELSIAGVTRLALFPDLDSVAEQVKWQYRE